MTRRLLLAVPLGAAVDPGSQEIGVLLRQLAAELNQPEQGDLRRIFTGTADFRRGSGPVVSVFERFRRLGFERQPWSERSPWTIRADSIRHIDSSHALVDATLTQYGSNIPKLEAALVLMVEKETGTWKVSSFRMPATVPSIPD